MVRNVQTSCFQNSKGQADDYVIDDTQSKGTFKLQGAC